MIRTIRTSLLIIFCAYAGFCLAGLVFQKVTEYNDFTDIAHTHSLVGFSFNLVVIGSAIACLAVVAGGLPIFIDILRSAWTHRRFGSLLLLAAPILAIALFMGMLTLLKAASPSDSVSTPGWPIALSRGVFVGTLLAVVMVSAGSWCFAVARNEISEKLLHFALFPAFLATIAMVLMLAATISWGFGLRGSAPLLFSGNDGIMGWSTTGTWLGVVISMGIATALAALALIRGLSARSTLQNAIATSR